MALSLHVFMDGQQGVKASQLQTWICSHDRSISQRAELIAPKNHT